MPTKCFVLNSQYGFIIQANTWVQSKYTNGWFCVWFLKIFFLNEWTNYCWQQPSLLCLPPFQTQERSGKIYTYSNRNPTVTFGTLKTKGVRKGLKLNGAPFNISNRATYMKHPLLTRRLIFRGGNKSNLVPTRRVADHVVLRRLLSSLRTDSPPPGLYRCSSCNEYVCFQTN